VDSNLFILLRNKTLKLDHERHMRQALALTTNTPELPFGAVIVHRDSGDTVAEGWNRSMINPIWHGEIVALNALFLSSHEIASSDLVLYTTAEPCPMCMAAILWSGLQMVVFGTSIRFLQKYGWRQIDLLAKELVSRSPAWKCTIIGGVLEDECNALFAMESPQSFPDR
jgi:tRNA(Arg) A34 adenosine deaminase TadA